PDHAHAAAAHLRRQREAPGPRRRRAGALRRRRRPGLEAAPEAGVAARRLRPAGVAGAVGRQLLQRPLARRTAVEVADDGVGFRRRQRPGQPVLQGPGGRTGGHGSASSSRARTVSCSILWTLLLALKTVAT